MPEIVNPYIAGKPLTTADMFFGREDVFEYVRKALRGKHRDNAIILCGQRRTGKTSVLYQMHHQLEEKYLCVFIDFHGLEINGINGLLWELANHIKITLKRKNGIDLPALEHEGFMTEPRQYFEVVFLNQIWEAIGKKHLMLMLDEAVRLQERIQAGKLEKDIFEYLRHLMQHHERLNFLFSLGSGVEEMEKEYAFLFSVGLTKKISFLERGAAIDLIILPVDDHYKVGQDAVERILQITSGHPYFTQLICHCIFNKWQRVPKSSIHADDVGSVVEEVVELSAPVLKFVWEGSNPVEKVVLAILASRMEDIKKPIGRREIKRRWKNLKLPGPEGEVDAAIQSLITRDVITGKDKYQFTIDLQRLWVQKYHRPEWVKEEVAEEIHTSPDKKKGVNWSPILMGLFAVIIVAAVIVATYKINDTLGIIRTINAVQTEDQAKQITKLSFTSVAGTQMAIDTLTTDTVIDRTQEPTATSTRSPSITPSTTVEATITNIAPTASPESTPELIALINVDALILRGGPDDTHNILGTYPKNEKLIIIEKDSESKWVKVLTPDGKVGWMWIFNLSIDQNIFIYIPTASVTPTLIPTNTLTPEPPPPPPPPPPPKDPTPP